MNDFKNKKILLGITGGISAYKSIFLLRELTNLGAKVKVILTESAKQFVTQLTLQTLSGEIVRSEIFNLDAEQTMNHIELARWADYLLIAPASANFIAKMAHGMADCLLSTLYLVADKIPVVVCPAMNQSMWQHPATVANTATLKKRGIIIVGPEHGIQACGECGPGRLIEIQHIINALRLYKIQNLLANKKVIITAGPTVEAIDPVRFISNHSSGKMGYAIAEAALMAGAQVTLISGPTNLTPHEAIKTQYVTSAVDMLNKTLENLENDSIFISTAAVADYRVENVSLDKLKRSTMQNLNLTLVKNPDILQEVIKTNKAAFTVGFAAETNNLLENAKNKLFAKKTDMIIANQVGKDLGFNKDENEVVILTKDKQINLKPNLKINLAGEIITIIAKNLFG